MNDSPFLDDAFFETLEAAILLKEDPAMNDVEMSERQQTYSNVLIKKSPARAYEGLK